MTLYVPAHFRVADEAELVEFIEKNAFGTLVSSSPQGLHVSHIPFIAERTAGGGLRLIGHMARANPHSSALAGADHVLAIFQGPHAYVSPTWYEHHPAVPTWNYAVVHAYGHAQPIGADELRDLVDRLATKYESGRERPWRLADAPADFIAKMLDVIAGFSITVERLDGKFKLSQNRPGDDARRSADALEREGETALAALMRDHPPKR